jgi:hypothetical protein
MPARRAHSESNLATVTIVDATLSAQVDFSERTVFKRDERRQASDW